ncbi:MAG: SAM-dependent methyltransferase [Bacteroidetes bacterium]|nr:SAM-dependent methyltransferase [Bacteroidota bacterium]
MSTIYLIPTLLAEEAQHTIPEYIIDAIKNCSIFFAENERTTRRFFKQIWPEMVIDNYEWVNMKDEFAALAMFKSKLNEGKNIGIISEAGCPGVADPGQKLIAAAQEYGASIKPLVGPSSILLALMASGMNGQQFRFSGYLPIDNAQRLKAIKELENDSAKKSCTEIFIETPYRNNQLIEAILKVCSATTKLCIAADITGKNEWIKTKSIAEWKKEKTDLHKRPAIFLLYAGN